MIIMCISAKTCIPDDGGRFIPQSSIGYILPDIVLPSENINYNTFICSIQHSQAMFVLSCYLHLKRITKFFFIYHIHIFVELSVLFFDNSMVYCTI
jgi:hypothetical protein